jgi:hypothetical protein
MEREYPCLFKCNNGETYLVLENPSEHYNNAFHIILRLDGNPTLWTDTSQVFFTLTMDAIERLHEIASSFTNIK